jgi:glutamate synthase (NADPH/NADH) large chain
MKKRPGAYGLYDPQFEHENCGVGFVANIKGVRSHELVSSAQDILCRMDHRGAVGAEANTGDGAGILTGLPYEFLERKASELGITLPSAGLYGAGIVFLPQQEIYRKRCKEGFEQTCKAENLSVLGWYQFPTNNSSLGPKARACEPHMEMVFLTFKSPFLTQAEDKKVKEKYIAELDLALYLARKRSTHMLRGKDISDPDDFFYISSLSSKIIVYKGMLKPEQLWEYYPDLLEKDYKSHLAMVHSRFSTNTFPSWDRAQPLRFMSHNGEINTLRGNVNKMKSRQGVIQSERFGDKLKDLFPIIEPDCSDSGTFDNVLELLHMSGRDLPEAVMMMIPEAWQNDQIMSQEKKALYEYYGNMMEPWDGPASVAFTDGRFIGAVLDRNGLRPSRYYVTKNDLVIMASEVGVLDVPTEDVIKKGRLQPGKMFLVNFDEHRIIDDQEIKHYYANKEDYRSWLEKGKFSFDDLPQPEYVKAYTEENLQLRQKIFGYSKEHKEQILKPMAELGKEPLGSMGNDAPLAVLSKKHRLISDYFKQLFAQVTNPPIDSIREKVIMSLRSNIGPEQNLLSSSPDHAKRFELNEPVISNEELAKLKELDHQGWRSRVIDICYPAVPGKEVFLQALDRVEREAEKAIDDGYSLIVLSDRSANLDRIPLPALLAVGAVHHHLVRLAKRTRIGIILESGEPRDVHQFCTLVGYGVDAVNPYLAFETLEEIRETDQMDLKLSKVIAGYKKAIGYGMRKVFGKMGISTLESYKGSQVFEILGLAKEVVDRCFSGTASRIKGIGFKGIARESYERVKEAGLPSSDLLSSGDFAFRSEGEKHMWDPESIAWLQMAVRQNDRNFFSMFSERQNQRSVDQHTLRGLLKLKKKTAIDIAEVETIDSIVKRFATGAMSFGSISKEAHESLAVAMNRLGGKSNTGEGGELRERYKTLENGDSKRSAIKQVASGRFGVTIEYLTNADEIQIKMAQGAKPGEGGELPGHKVGPVIAKTRHSTEGVGLISPPPHHDIYSIEDLAQLIFDLKNSNPGARISVKLVSEVGVGTIAAGVAKAHADHILISGHDGGTGASPLTGIKHAGLPWELGLAETHQTLVMNDLRSRVVIQTDGQLKTGRDVVIAAILGAEEFGFATSALITQGCIMMRKCQKNTCPVGVATQDERLRAKFTGKPEHLIHFFTFIAEEARELMAELGVKSIDELIGRTDLLETDPESMMWKSSGIDLEAMLVRPLNDLAKTGVYKQIDQDHGIETVLDRKLIEAARVAIDTNTEVEATFTIVNTDRAVGTMLSHEIAKVYGLDGLPEDSIRYTFHGSAGQSFGAWLANGVQFTLYGDSNDYVGKGLSGGNIIIRPEDNISFNADENIIIGNVAFYGAISGQAFIRGMAAERFAVRNSGAELVVEGVGDHGCEYMTGGRVIVLGETGKNFAAGMSGGIAYVYDPQFHFPERVNQELVTVSDLQYLEETDYLLYMIKRHYELTGSLRAKYLLDRWSEESRYFRKVASPRYLNILEEQRQRESLREQLEQQEMLHGAS